MLLLYQTESKNAKVILLFLQILCYPAQTVAISLFLTQSNAPCRIKKSRCKSSGIWQTVKKPMARERLKCFPRGEAVMGIAKSDFHD
jgi:hypothetical protein